MSSISVERFINVMMLMRKRGISVRQIARFLGESKSSIHRLLQMIETLQALEASKLGQGHENAPAISTEDQSPTVPDQASRAADNTAPEQQSPVYSGG